MTCTGGAAPSATTTRSNGSSARRTTCATSIRQQVRADLGGRAHPAKLHRPHQLGRQDLERAARARLAARHRAEERRPAGKHPLRAERAGLQDVDAAAHAAIEAYGDFLSY